MADLEDNGLLYSPHTSAGRRPTEAGLRYFVNGLLECADFAAVPSEAFDALLADPGVNRQAVLEKATALLSQLSQCAGVLVAPRSDPILKHIEFISLNENQILVILVSQSGQVENRVITNGPKLDASQLQQISNYLSERLCGKNLADGCALLQQERRNQRGDFDALMAQLARQGLEIFETNEEEAALIMRGHAHLLENVDELDELREVRQLFDALETKTTMVKLLTSVASADGIQVFIGSENPYFQLSGCSLIVSPYRSQDRKVVGAIGVVGPEHMQYRRIIPLVNYTSHIISRLLGAS